MTKRKHVGGIMGDVVGAMPGAVKIRIANWVALEKSFHGPSPECRITFEKVGGNVKVVGVFRIDTLSVSDEDT